MDLRPTSLEDLLDDLDAEHEDLDVLVRTLDEPGWDRSTPAEGWTVRDQVSHLAYFDDASVAAMNEPDTFAALVEAALAGGDPMEEHLRRGRAMSGAALLAWWRASRAAVGAAARSRPDGARVPWFGPPMSMMSFVSARLMETWAHGQDIADALEVRRVATSRLRHIARLGVRTRSYSYVARGLTEPVTPVTVALTGPAGEDWVWEESGAPSDRVQGSALDFCLVVTQRRHVADTGLIVEGVTASQWMSIAQAFAGPPGPGRQAGRRS